MLGSSCYCLSSGSVVVKRSFSSGGNQEEGPACLYSYLISSLLPKSISSHLLHCVTSFWECLGMGSLEAKRSGKKKKKKIPPEFQQSASLCHWHSVLQDNRASSATCLCPGGTPLLPGLCAVLGTGPSLDGPVPVSHTV